MEKLCEPRGIFNLTPFQLSFRREQLFCSLDIASRATPLDSL